MVKKWKESKLKKREKINNFESNNNQTNKKNNKKKTL